MGPQALQVSALMGSRCCVSAAFALANVALPSMLLRANKGKSMRSQRVMALVDTLNNMATFLLMPLAGNFIDMGRKPVLVACACMYSVARFVMALHPTNGTYALYRVMVMLAFIPFSAAFNAMLADRLGGRASDAFARVDQRLWMLLAMTRLVFTSIAEKTGSARKCMLLAGVMNGLAAVLLALTTRESLPRKQRTVFRWSRAANPFGFIQMFTRPRLRRLAALLMLQSVCARNSTGHMYRGHAFGWGLKEQAQLTQIGNITSLVSPLLRLPILQRLGNVGAIRLASRLQCVIALNTALSPMGHSLWANPLLEAFCHGRTGLSREVSTAASSLGIGQGELEASKTNLTFPTGLVCPSFYSEAFSLGSSVGIPGLPFLISGGLQLVCSELVLPWAMATRGNPVMTFYSPQSSQLDTRPQNDNLSLEEGKQAADSSTNPGQTPGTAP